MARSGVLTIPAGGFTRGTASKPGGFYTFSFDTGYTYTGGDLLVTINSHLTSGSNTLILDAFTDPAFSTNDLNDVTSYGNTAYKTLGNVDATYRPVVELVYSMPAVPEPATWLSAILGFGMIGAMARRERRNPIKTC